MLSKEDGAQLIKLAKEAVKSYFKEQSPKVSKEIKSKFSMNAGVFVTLNKGKQLRGCIGYIKAHLPLWDAVINAARNAAFEDLRFPPTTEQELKDITFEISVLTEPKPLQKKSILKQIEIGRHGLIVERGIYTGLLLPQVFTEFRVDAESALEMTCEKAGLPTQAWKDADTKIYCFECQIFKE